MSILSTSSYTRNVPIADLSRASATKRQDPVDAARPHLDADLPEPAIQPDDLQSHR